jgi:ADP-ribose pyrophosphatase
MAEKKSELKGEPKPEKLLLRKIVFEGRAMKVRVDTVLGPDGRRSTREVVERNDCIAVVAIDAQENVLMVNQFRTPLWKNLLEIPAGGIEKRETVETAVIREMREETGFRPDKVVRLCGFFFSPGFTNEYCHLYLAQDLIPDPLNAEDTAGIELVKLPLAEVLPAINSGKIQDGKSIAGLMYYLEYKKNMPVNAAPAAKELLDENKDTLKQEWDELQAVPLPKPPDDEPLADLFADLVLENGETGGIVTSFLSGKKVDKSIIFLDEDLNRRLQSYQPRDSASRQTQQELIAWKNRLDRLVKLVLDLYDK